MKTQTEKCILPKHLSYRNVPKIHNNKYLELLRGYLISGVDLHKTMASAFWICSCSLGMHSPCQLQWDPSSKCFLFFAVSFQRKLPIHGNIRSRTNVWLSMFCLTKFLDQKCTTASDNEYLQKVWHDSIWTSIHVQTQSRLARLFLSFKAVRWLLQTKIVVCFHHTYV